MGMGATSNGHATAASFASHNPVIRQGDVPPPQLPPWRVLGGRMKGLAGESWHGPGTHGCLGCPSPCWGETVRGKGGSWAGG